MTCVSCGGNALDSGINRFPVCAACYPAYYGFVFFLCRLQDVFAPINEAWLRKRFWRSTDTVPRYGPRGAREVVRAFRQEMWREMG